MENKDELEALHNLREHQDNAGKSPSFLVCECCCISNIDIRDYLISKNINYVDLELLKRDLKLGSGCNSCEKNFDSWKTKIFDS